MPADCLRKLRLLCEDFPRSHNLVLIGQPPLLQSLSLTVNEEIRSRVTYSVVLPRLSPETIEAFILGQLDRAGLGHNTFTPEALALIVRSGEGLLRRTRNLCLSSLIEAVRDQTRIVDLKQVNRVLIQPHWRKDCDNPLINPAHARARVGRANKSAPPGWPRWCHSCNSADSNSSYARRTTLPCPPIPVSSSKTATGAGRSAIWPATPLTSTSRSSACPSTTPCARSPAPKTSTGVVAVRRQCGQNPGAKSNPRLYDASVESQGVSGDVRCQCGQK